MFTVDSFMPGQRIQFHPATDIWMRGCKFAFVLKVGRKYITVRRDDGKRVRITPRAVGEIL